MTNGGAGSGERPASDTGPKRPIGPRKHDRRGGDLTALLQAVAARVEVARRLEGNSEEALLRSVVDAAVELFEAEAASISLYDPPTDQLVFAVAAGEQGQGVIGLAIPHGQGVAWYVFSTGQSLALSDVTHDPRFDQQFSQRTGYVPRSIVAVPLIDGERPIGVLEVLDKRDSAAFSLRDVELAGVFAGQAAVAIAATRMERDTHALLTSALRRLGGETLDREGAERIVADATAELGGEDDSRLWALTEQVARLRRADPAQVSLLADLLNVLVRHAEARAQRAGARARRRAP